MALYIAGIEYDSTVDGPGLRTTLFFQGCAHKCKGCHNPQTHPFNTGTVYTAPYTDLIKNIEDNAISKQITFSGGDPLYQLTELDTLVSVLEERGYHDFILYTGFTVEEIMDSKYFSTMRQTVLRVLPKMYYVICDPFLEEKKSLNLLYRGSSNQRIVRFSKLLLEERLTYVDCTESFTPTGQCL